MAQTHTKKHVDQWNRIEYTHISPNNYSYLILNKGAKKHTLE
jgi:hypothetical protein